MVCYSRSALSCSPLPRSWDRSSQMSGGLGELAIGGEELCVRMLAKVALPGNGWGMAEG